MKQLVPSILFVASIICILCVGFYPQMCVLFYPAFCGLALALFIQTYSILRVKKQATIKAYYKPDSILHRYFAHFTLVRFVSFFVALVGSVTLFFMLIFPSGSEIFLLCLLVPISIYGFRVINFICKANISGDFASVLALKYTAIVCALVACLIEIIFANSAQGAPIMDTQTHYQNLLQSYHIAQMPCQIWQEIFAFILLKKAILDMLYANVADTYLHIGLEILFACGHFASFVSFCLLCVGSERGIYKYFALKKPKREAKENQIIESTQDLPAHTRSFRQFFTMLFFLISLYIAFNISIHLQSLAKSTSALPPLLSSQILEKNAPYITLSIQGAQGFINSSDVPALTHKLQSNVADFQSQLDSAVQGSVDEYFVKEEVIINEYSKWYFSVYGEYTRLFYAAIGKGEEIAQEQFIFLLKTYTPYDLEAHLNDIYDKALANLKPHLQQSFNFFITYKKPNNAQFTQNLSFSEINHKLDLLSPRATDGIAAIFSASVAGSMILKSSAKMLGKSTAKVVGKTAVKKGISTTAGAGGAILCGALAPLCAIGFFVASDYAINSVDEVLNEDAFKAQMREGFTQWKIQLKNSLVSYNAQLSKQILQTIPLESSPTSSSSQADSIHAN
ncbi:hypothetical protein LS71_005830 [Helicobacter jaachi]|uniref:Uncharacterized protein n=1 Tax=Helicobacter jaachi TaxID=1677920 RepID=A0A4U8TBK1_9HELI|nr:hypothetical protein [Helicobacter jaachi]TLD96578.1 hypothetical protein LS71_005830 [Helicobacter jaachi]